MYFSTAVPEEMQHTYQILRSVIYGSGNVSRSGLAQVATAFGLKLDKTFVIQDNVGAPVVTADCAIYFLPGTNVKIDDQLLDIGDGSRWRVVKVFLWPAKTVVWAARGTS